MKKWIVVLLIAGALLLRVLLSALRREAPPAAAVPEVPLVTATPVPSPTPAPTPSPTPVPTPAPRSRGWFGEAVFVGGFTHLRIQNTETHAYDTSIYDFGGITHENAEILF